MSTELKPGDRVHVTSQRPFHGYQPGCTGIVRSGPNTDKGGKTNYGVAMDKDDGSGITLFLADEIEPLSRPPQWLNESRDRANTRDRPVGKGQRK